MNQRWSFSKWNSYQRCPTYFEYRYVKNETPSNPPSKYGAIGQSNHESIAKYLTGEKDNIPSHVKYFSEQIDSIKNQIEQQKEIIIEIPIYLNKDLCKIKDFLSEQVGFIGIIDCLILLKEYNYAVVVDWKTGYRRAINTDKQLELYALCVFESFEDIDEIETILYYTKNGYTDSIKFYKEDMEIIKQKWIDEFSSIENMRDFNQTNNKSNCKNCEYKKICENESPIFKII